MHTSHARMQAGYRMHTSHARMQAGYRMHTSHARMQAGYRMHTAGLYGVAWLPLHRSLVPPLSAGAPRSLGPWPLASLPGQSPSRAPAPPAPHVSWPPSAAPAGPPLPPPPSRRRQRLAWPPSWPPQLPTGQSRVPPSPPPPASWLRRQTPPLPLPLPHGNLLSRMQQAPAWAWRRRLVVGPA
jgi:hypothetical protein